MIFFLQNVFPDSRHDDDVVVNENPADKDDQANWSSEGEVVLKPAEEGAQGDEDDADLVEHSPSRGRQLLCYGYSCKVEDSNGAHVPKGPGQQPAAVVPIKDHFESVQHVLKPIIRSHPELVSHVDKVHWPHQNEQCQGTVYSFKPDYFQRCEPVLSQILFFVHELNSVEKLTNKNQDDSNEHIDALVIIFRGFCGRARLGCGVSSSTGGSCDIP